MSQIYENERSLSIVLDTPSRKSARPHDWILIHVASLSNTCCSSLCYVHDTIWWHDCQLQEWSIIQLKLESSVWRTKILLRTKISFLHLTSSFSANLYVTMASPFLSKDNGNGHTKTTTTMATQYNQQATGQNRNDSSTFGLWRAHFFIFSKLGTGLQNWEQESTMASPLFWFQLIQRQNTINRQHESSRPVVDQVGEGGLLTAGEQWLISDLAKKILVLYLSHVCF